MTYGSKSDMQHGTSIHKKKLAAKIVLWFQHENILTVKKGWLLKPRMGQNGTLRNFLVISKKSVDLGLGIPKSKFLGFRERYSMASGRRI